MKDGTKTLQLEAHQFCLTTAEEINFWQRNISRLCAACFILQKSETTWVWRCLLFQDIFFLFICALELQRPQFQRAHALALDKKHGVSTSQLLANFQHETKIESAGDFQLNYQAVARVSGNTSQPGGPCVYSGQGSHDSPHLTLALSSCFDQTLPKKYVAGS